MINIGIITFKNGKTTQLKLRKYSYEYVTDFFDHQLFQGVLLSSNPYIYIYCDDEGKLKGMPKNEQFHEYLQSRSFVLYDDIIVGPVICFESDEEAMIFDGQVDPITKQHIG